MNIAKLNEMDLLVTGLFEKAEEMMEKSRDPGEAASEFLLALTNCLGIFHDIHYPHSTHELLMSQFAATVVEKAKISREYENAEHIHFKIVIERNKK